MAKAYFITATDTEIGKTFITAGLGYVAQKIGVSVGISKPISCGGIEDALFYKQRLQLKNSIDQINPVKFRQPLSPYAAMKTENIRIDINKIRKSVHQLMVNRELVLVEGLGGAQVPIKKDYFVADLIKDLRMPCIIIGRAGLGTINHTLMTIETLKKRKIKIAGIILNCYSGKELSERTNAKVIEELSGIKVIGRISAKSSFGSLVRQIKEQKIAGKLL